MTESRAQAGGIFRLWAALPDGTYHYRTAHNLIVNEGLTYVAAASFLDDTSGVATWYVGLTGSNPTVSATDTLASHGGWTEYTAYDEVSRQQWSAVAAATAGAIDSSGFAATFTIASGGGTVGGAFLTDQVSGTAGKLHCGSAFDEGNLTLPGGAVVKVEYSWAIADDGA